MKDMGLKENIKSKRTECQMTLEELAEKVGVSRQTIQRYESGTISNIPSDKIELMANALKTTPAYLMGWEENITENKDVDELDPDIRRIQRAREKMPESGRAYMMDMLKRSFSEYFEDDGEDDPD